MRAGILTLSATALLLAGCVTTGSNDLIAGASQAMRGMNGSDTGNRASRQASTPAQTPQVVVDYMAFAAADRATMAKIGGTRLGNDVPESAQREITFVENTSTGTRSYKVSIRARQEIAVPQDALETRSAQLADLLKAVTLYSADRSKTEPTTIYARARNKADRDFLLAGLKPLTPAPELGFMSAIDPHRPPVLLLMSNGAPIRTIPK